MLGARQLFHIPPERKTIILWVEFPKEEFTTFFYPKLKILMDKTNLLQILADFLFFSNIQRLDQLGHILQVIKINKTQLRFNENQLHF